jgi:hypothetical protein
MGVMDETFEEVVMDKIYLYFFYFRFIGAEKKTRLFFLQGSSF